MYPFIDDVAFVHMYWNLALRGPLNQFIIGYGYFQEYKVKKIILVW